MCFETAVDENFFSATPGFEKGPATSANNGDTWSLFKLKSEISPSAS